MYSPYLLWRYVGQAEYDSDKPRETQVPKLRQLSGERISHTQKSKNAILNPDDCYFSRELVYVLQIH